MGLNIKNPRVEDNIRKLAERTKRSLTDTIDDAVKAELRRLDAEERNATPLEPLLTRLQPLLDEIAKARTDWRNSKQIMDEVDHENEP